MTNLIALTDLEQSALNHIFKIGRDCCGMTTIEDMKGDNMTWFNTDDLIKAMGVNKNQAAGIMSALDSKGLAMNYDPTMACGWCLTDTGLDHCQPEATLVRYGAAKIAKGLDAHSAPQTFGNQRSQVGKGKLLKGDQPNRERAASAGYGKGKFDGLTLTTTMTENPRKKDTFGWHSFNIVLKQQPISYADYRAAGGRPNDLQWDLDHKFVDGKRDGSEPVETPAKEEAVAEVATVAPVKIVLGCHDGEAPFTKEFDDIFAAKEFAQDFLGKTAKAKIKMAPEGELVATNKSGKKTIQAISGAVTRELFGWAI